MIWSVRLTDTVIRQLLRYFYRYLKDEIVGSRICFI